MSTVPLDHSYRLSRHILMNRSPNSLQVSNLRVGADLGACIVQRQIQEFALESMT